MSATYCSVIPNTMSYYLRDYLYNTGKKKKETQYYNQIILNVDISYKYDFINEKLEHFSIETPDFKASSKTTIQSVKSLIEKAKGFSVDIFQSFEGEIQVNFYSDTQEPLEILIQNHSFEILYPNDELATFHSIPAVFKEVKKYFEA